LAIALASALAASPPALALTHRGSSHGTPSGRLTVGTSPSAHAAVTPGTRIAANIELGPVSAIVCLDDVVGSHPGLFMTPCAAAQNELWGVDVVNAAGDVRFQNNFSHGCLAEKPGTGVVLEACNPSSKQQ